MGIRDRVSEASTEVIAAFAPATVATVVLPIVVPVNDVAVVAAAKPALREPATPITRSSPTLAGSYTHPRVHETKANLECRLLLAITKPHT